MRSSEARAATGSDGRVGPQVALDAERVAA